MVTDGKDGDGWQGWQGWVRSVLQSFGMGLAPDEGGSWAWGASLKLRSDPSAQKLDEKGVASRRLGCCWLRGGGWAAAGCVEAAGLLLAAWRRLGCCWLRGGP